MHRDELPSAIDHEATDAIVRKVADFTFRQFEALFCHLQKSTSTPIYTHSIGSRESDAVADVDCITFLTQILVLFQCKNNIPLLSFSFGDGRRVVEHFLTVIGNQLGNTLQLRLVLGIDNAGMLV